MRSIVCLPVCLVLFLLCCTAETSQRSLNCCLKNGNCRIMKDRVVDYRVQKAGACPISAIVLRKKQGKAKCCDPGSEWTKDIMKMVDQKKMSKQNSDPKASTRQNRMHHVKKAIQFVDEKKAINMTSYSMNSASTTSTELSEFINVSGFSYCPCLKTSETVLHKENIKSYQIQRGGVCHIDAIVFKTVNGLTFCANPQNLWVKRVMQFLDKATATEMTAHPLNSTSTFKTESRLKTTTHWNVHVANRMAEGRERMARGRWCDC